MSERKPGVRGSSAKRAICALLWICGAADTAGCAKKSNGGVEASGVTVDGGASLVPSAQLDADQPLERDGGSDMSHFEDASREAVTSWFQVMDQIGQLDYIELDNFKRLVDGAQVEIESRKWSERFFLAEASPYSSAIAVKRSVHASTKRTFDVLRHRYVVGQLDLVVFETAEFMVVEIERGEGNLLNLSDREKVDRINNVAVKVLRMQGRFIGTDMGDQVYQWAFRFPPAISEGTRFSTDPRANVDTMWSWANRADGGIRNGHLYFFLFKKREATSGRVVFLDMWHWFDGKCWDPYRGPRRR